MSTLLPWQCVDIFQLPSRGYCIIGRVVKFAGYVHQHKSLSGNIFGLILKNKMAAKAIGCDQGVLLHYSCTVKGITDKVLKFALYTHHYKSLPFLYVPLYVSPVLDQRAWDIDALNINWSGPTAYAYPPTVLLLRVI